MFCATFCTHISLKGCHGTQHAYQHIKTERNDTQHSSKIGSTLNVKECFIHIVCHNLAIIHSREH
jgi:hypothetical protein